MEKCSDVIEHMDRTGFAAAIARAKGESEQAAEALALLQLWQQRLQPYLEREPQQTIADAIDCYNADRRT